MSKPNNINQAPIGLPIKRPPKDGEVGSTPGNEVVSPVKPETQLDTTDSVERMVDQPDEDDQEDLDDARDEAEDFEDALDTQPFRPQEEILGESNTVPDLEGENDKFRVIVEGARSTNPNYKNIIPFDLKLTKIKSTDDRMNARLGAECLLLTVDMFGPRSLPTAHMWEEYKTEVSILSADNGFTATNLITTRQESTLSKKVSKQEQRAQRGGMLGGMRRETQPGENSGDAFY